MQLQEKYRPTDLKSVIGQDKAVRKIRTLEARGLTGRAFWISGASGTGKTTIARIVAGLVADEVCTVEVDGGELTTGTLDDFERSMHLYGMGKPGRAFIINEAQGLSKRAIRRLLVLLEPIPAHDV